MIVVASMIGAAGCYDLGSEPRRVEMQLEDVSRSNGTVTMEVRVYAEPGTNSHHTYRDVSLVFYGANKSAIERVPFGDVTTNNSVKDSPTVTVELDMNPKYVVPVSSHFRETENQLLVKGLYYRSYEGGVWQDYVVKENRTFPENETNTN
jgi:hypothetical protein